MAFIMQWVLSAGPDLAWRAGNDSILEVSYVPSAQLFAVLAIGWGGFAALLSYLMGQNRRSIGGMLGAAFLGPWVLAIPLAFLLVIDAIFTANPALPMGDSPLLLGAVWAAACATLGTIAFFAVLKVARRARQRRATVDP